MKTKNIKIKRLAKTKKSNLLIGLIKFLAKMALKAILLFAMLIASLLTKLFRIREVRGFFAGILAALIAVIALASNYQTAAQAPAIPVTVENNEIPATLDTRIVQPVTAPKPVKAPANWNVDFVNKTYSEKVALITKRLRHLKVSESEIKTFVRIATLESCRDKSNLPTCFHPKKTPPVAVKHCKSKSSGKWYVVEISNGRQAYCRAGDTEGRNERSFGVFQILETTWKGNKCSGDKYTWYKQVDCAVKIKRTYGFNQWSTY